jgi:hypothetical protein
MTETEALRRQRYVWLTSWIMRHQPQVRLRINTNRNTMLSMRATTNGYVVSLHEHMLSYPAAVEELPTWIVSRGRKTSAVLRQALIEVFHQQRQQGGTKEQLQQQRKNFPVLPAPKQPLDLDGALDQVHGTWFSDISRPLIVWGRDPGTRQLSSIRFGSYRRRPSPLITLHPRLKRAWVPWTFIEHVLFHELCHHRQACEPIRGEAQHSARFRGWEKAYPQHQIANDWQRLFLEFILQGNPQINGEQA